MPRYLLELFKKEWSLLSKKRQRQEEEGTLKDLLQDDLVKQLQSKKADLKKQEEERKEEEKQKRIEERKQREANKSFEELLNDSNLDWKSFKK